MDGTPRIAANAEPASGPRIRIHTLGRFAIEIDGRPLDFSGRLPKRPLDLLKAIIARGGRNVAVAALCADLWPDADGATAMQSFNVTLHRLRKLLDVKPALVVHGGCVQLDPAVCWVDADVFERTVAQMDGHADSRPGLSDGSVERFDAALDLYQGAFLPMHDDPWSATLRERLRSKFVRAVRAYSARCDRLGQRDLAIAVYRRAIEIDPLAEELYHRLMTEYNALGQAAEAVALYRRCRLMLGKLLGVTPGLQTRELYDTIQQTAQLAAETRAEANVEGLAAGSGAAHRGLDPPGRPAAVQALDL
jgi:DNA-binding SARP family transcriptional activator